MNKTMLTGYLTQDPNLTYTPSGNAVCNFSIAVNRRWNDADGNRQEETMWVRCAAWRGLAENVAKYMKKGRQVLVEGHFVVDPATGSPRIYTKTDGTPGTSFELRCDTVEFLGGGGGAQADNAEEAPGEPEPF